MQGFHLLEIINISVTLFCHGRSEWRYTVLALKGQYVMYKIIFTENLLEFNVDSS